MSLRPCQGGFLALLLDTGGFCTLWEKGPRLQHSCLFLHSTQSNLYACTFLVSTQWMLREKNWCVLMVSSFFWGLQRFETVTLGPPKPFTVGWKSSYFLPVHFYDSHLFLLCFVNCERVSFSCLSSEGLFTLWNSVNLVALQPQLSDEPKKLTIPLIIWLFLLFIITDGEVLLLILYKLSGNNPRVDCLNEPCCSLSLKVLSRCPLGFRVRPQHLNLTCQTFCGLAPVHLTSLNLHSRCRDLFISELIVSVVEEIVVYIYQCLGIIFCPLNECFLLLRCFRILFVSVYLSIDCGFV